MIQRDDELMREIGQLLDVEPSPEFAAKVRGQIQSAPESRPLRWMLVPACAAATLGVIWFLASTVPGGSTPVPFDATPVQQASVGPDLVIERGGDPSVSMPIPPPRQSAATDSESRAAALPEPIIAQDEIAALKSYLAAVATGSPPVGRLNEQPDGELALLSPLAPIEIPEIVMTALALGADVSEGVAQ